MLNIRVPIMVVCNWNTAITYASTYKIYTEKSLTTGKTELMAKNGSGVVLPVRDAVVQNWVESVARRMDAQRLTSLHLTENGTVSAEWKHGNTIYENLYLYQDRGYGYNVRIYGTRTEFLDAMQAAAARMRSFEQTIEADEQAVVQLAAEISAEAEHYFERALNG